jgi:hypothetical protein
MSFVVPAGQHAFGNSGGDAIPAPLLSGGCLHSFALYLIF